ncbi:GNAT family N-acetyltransferase [Paenibacillus guangzhouensis]|uniref:GNAT family N-acetyltransferase n=1 Tax=Paenibacillus guangzhouensis TaxID=1473112 RepID=UPI001266A8A5|nr:GNAT family N-acetyltransferase [Paenibacillus guangzhouensis]
MKLPILLDFPDRFETERLLVRSPQPGDGRAVYEAIVASLEDLKPWLGFAYNEQSEEQSEANLREAHAKFMQREDLRLLIFHKETQEFIGSSGLHNANWNIPKFEIGYWIDSRHAGKGYMTEAVQGIAAFAFDMLKAKRVEIRCDRLNARSRAVAERAGFELEGTLRNNNLSTDGQELRDQLVFSKIRADKA